MKQEKTFGLLFRPMLRTFGLVIILLLTALTVCAHRPVTADETLDPTAVNAAPQDVPEAVKTVNMSEYLADIVAAVETQPSDAAVAAPVEDNTIYSDVERCAEFPGGEEDMQDFILGHLQYPAVAANTGLQGRVVIDFVVEKDGSLSEFTVLRSPDASLSDEAIRIAKLMPAWKPARLHGKEVRARGVMAVAFHL